MISVKQQLVSELSRLGTVRYELAVDSSTPLPCITYIESANTSDKEGETIRTSYVDYTIKVWANMAATIDLLAPQIDAKMKALGFWRTASQEITIDNIICKIMVFEGLAVEME